MSISAKVICDSLTPWDQRLTTFELRCPMGAWIHLLTHRAFSRNASSRRAVPVREQIDEVEGDPYVPVEWERNGKGMVARGEVADPLRCRVLWSEATSWGLSYAEYLSDLGVHKAIVGDLLTPFSWVKGVVTSSEPGLVNWWRQRCADDARPHTRVLAVRMLAAYRASSPRRLEWGGWHLPMVDEAEREAMPAVVAAWTSAARCARVSYNSHSTGKRSTPAEDLDLAAKLKADGHWSPFEHPSRANPTATARQHRNLGPGWHQLRADLEPPPGELPPFDADSLLAKYHADLEVQP